MEKPYQNREVDKMFLAVHDRFDTQDRLLKEIVSLQQYTNGKVKKIIIAIFLIGGFLLGFAGKEILPILTKLAL